MAMKQNAHIWTRTLSLQQIYAVHVEVVRLSTPEMTLMILILAKENNVLQLISVNLDLFAETKRMKVAIQSQSASLTQLITVKVLMEHGEDTQLNPTDTGSLTMTAQLATGSVRTAK
jgi:phenylacetate-coenzyme A ligase PaaK-like adenylate-forming protein